MNKESDRFSIALSRWANRMAVAHRMQADAYDLLASSATDPIPAWQPASELAVAERPQRQALLLAAVKAKAASLRAKSIPRGDWLILAAHFGYDPRGTAGFFRRAADGTAGLLVIDNKNDTVSVGDAGKRRLEEYRVLIKQHEDEIAASVAI